VQVRPTCLECSPEPLRTQLVRAPVDSGRPWPDAGAYTPFGDSGWKGVSTTLTPGTISVASGAADPKVSEWGMVVMPLLMPTAGALLLMPCRGPAACPR
jgi:hypothetical protein